MAETLTFEDKIKGLADYYRALEDVEVHDPGHEDPRSPDRGIFYFGSHAISQGLRKAQREVLYQIACHGSREYDTRKLGERELRAETSEERAERADILAVMTSPQTPELRTERAAELEAFLERVVGGEDFGVGTFKDGSVRFRPQELVTIDTDRPLFAVFRNSHISSTALSVQYDSPVTFNPQEGYVGDVALTVDIPDMFKGDGLIHEPAAAA